LIVALVFAHVWGVIQLIVLGSFARTVRVRTVLMALAVGLYLCAPLAMMLQMAWTRPAAWLTDVPLFLMVVTASYTLNPFIEEVVKVLPVAALLLIPTMRRQWSLTDCVLMGAAVGSGFGLAESLFRYGDEAYRASSIDHGWVLQTNISFPVVPSVWSSINSWLPQAGAPWEEISVSGRFPLSPHLVWSALGGLAVGLIVLRRGWMWRTLAVVLLVYVGVDHAAGNAAVRSQQFIGRAAIEQLRTQLWLAPILALVLAWWLDRQRQQAAKGDEVILAAEQSASPRLVGTLRAASSSLPWSLPRVYGFVRLRRAHNSERTLPLPSRAPEDLSRPLVQLRDRIDRQLGPGRSSPLLPPGWIGAVIATSRRPTVIVWLLLMVPSVMWFVIGGFPQTAALQKTMTQPLAWNAIIWLSVFAQIWLAWRVTQGLRASPAALRLPSADDAALVALRVACGVGAIGLGGHALMRGLSGFSPNSSVLDFFNATEAYASATPATTLPLANGASAAVPPRAAAGTYIGEVDDADFVSGGEGTYIGEVDDPDFVNGGEGTYIGEVDDPNFLGDRTPSEGAPDMSLEEMKKWAADADAREAHEAAEAADVRAAEAKAAWDQANEGMHEQDRLLANSLWGAGPAPGDGPGSFGAAQEAGAGDVRARMNYVAAKTAADVAHAHAAVADADAAVARAGTDSELAAARAAKAVAEGVEAKKQAERYYYP
jgi:hypothetical protein